MTGYRISLLCKQIEWIYVYIHSISMLLFGDQKPGQTGTVLNILWSDNRMASVGVCQHRKIAIMCSIKYENTTCV